MTWNNWLLIYGCCFGTAFILSLITTPLCKKLAHVTGYLDIPAAEMHKGHRKATPLLGGLAMCLAWSLTIAIGFSAALILRSGPIADSISGIISSAKELLVILFGGIAATVLGLIDDKHPLKASVKFAGQLLIALAVVISGGIRITFFVENIWISCIGTVFWFLFIFNAFNFFDNMDGLAAGTAAIAFFFFGIAAAVNQQYFVASLCACSAAAVAGFWVYNSSPASIFMGDAGSHFLAFMLSVVAAKVTYYNPEIAATRFAILIPLFILAVPVFDTFAVVVIRLKNHKPIYVGDHNHISHRFWHMGMSRARAVNLVHLLVLVTCLGALPLLWGGIGTCIVLLVQGAAILLLLSIMQYTGIQANKNNEEKNK